MFGVDVSKALKNVQSIVADKITDLEGSVPSAQDALDKVRSVAAKLINSESDRHAIMWMIDGKPQINVFDGFNVSIFSVEDTNSKDLAQHPILGGTTLVDFQYILPKTVYVSIEYPDNEAVKVKAKLEEMLNEREVFISVISDGTMINRLSLKEYSKSRTTEQIDVVSVNLQFQEIQDVYSQSANAVPEDPVFDYKKFAQSQAQSAAKTVKAVLINTL